MPPAMRTRVIFACGSLLVAPLMHAALTHDRLLLPAIGAGAAQAGLGVWLATPRWRGGQWSRCIAAGLAGGAVLASGLWTARLSLGALSGLTHAALYLMLLTIFAGSLRPGRTPAATLVARAAHGPLSPELLRYTRGVTWLWAGFSALQLLLSLLLLILGSTRAWSLFVNTLDLPLMLLLFAGEYAYRRHRFRDLPRLSREQLRRALDALFSTRNGLTWGEPARNGAARSGPARRGS